MDRLAFALYRSISSLLNLLPLHLVFRLGYALGFLTYFLTPTYRRLVLHNLSIAFPKELSPKELRALARQHFATLGANLFSSIKLPTLSQKEIQAVVSIEGLQTILDGNAAGGGFIMAISHLGSWEMFAQSSPLYFHCPVGTIFQALSNPFIDAEIRRDRARLGLELFERKAGFIKGCQFVRNGGALGILMDQHAGDAGLWTPFFDRLASTSTLPATLALRTGARLASAAVFTAGVARWRFVVFPTTPVLPTDTAESLTFRLNSQLEDQIRSHPADWFWVHNRWKTPRPQFLLHTSKRGVFLPPSPSLQPFKILIRASNWLGDAVISTPAVRAIKAGRPDAHLTILTPAKLAGLWREVPEVDAVIPILPHENLFQVARKIRHQFDAAILFPNSLRTALEIFLARIPRRVGRPGHHRRWLLNQIFQPKRSKKKSSTPTPPQHQVHDYLALAAFIGADPTYSPPLPTPRPIPTSRPPIIGLCPGAEYGPAKRWLPERFASTLHTLHQRTDCSWKIFGVEKDRPIADAIIASAHLPASHLVDLVGKTSLAQLHDELRSCDLLLTNDTGTMHLAALLNVPTVSLFGSTEPSLTGPLGPLHHIIRNPTPCSPCFLRSCPIDFPCMTSISVDQVVAALESSLAQLSSPTTSSP